MVASSTGSWPRRSASPEGCPEVEGDLHQIEDRDRPEFRQGEPPGLDRASTHFMNRGAFGCHEVDGLDHLMGGPGLRRCSESSEKEWIPSSEMGRGSRPVSSMNSRRSPLSGCSPQSRPRREGSRKRRRVRPERAASEGPSNLRHHRWRGRRCRSEADGRGHRPT